MTSELITESARKLFDRDFDLAFMRRLRASDASDKLRLVQLCQEMGWHGLIVAEEYGGFGYGLDALCALLQELGKGAFPSLYLSHFVAPALLLDVLPHSPARSRMLAAIARGEVTPALAITSSTIESFCGLTAFCVEAAGAASAISGASQWVCDIDSANVLLVPARAGDGSISVFAIRKEDPGVLVTARADQIYGKTFSVTCASVVPGENALLGTVPSTALVDVYGACAISQSAQLIGSARRAMAFSIAHIMMRKQFGKALAEFQAVQHQVADMYKVIEVAQLLLNEAIADGRGDEGRERASLCKAWANDAAVQVAATSHQLMGGTGYMMETDLHLLTDFVLRAQYEFGSADYHRELIAARLFDRPTSPDTYRPSVAP